MSYTLEPAPVRAPEFSGPLTEWLIEVIPQEAGSVHKSYGLVPAEDYEQEMWVKALDRRDSFEELIAQLDYGKARQRLKEAAWGLVREDERYRRAVKAASAGYRAVDEQFYTNGVLKVLLPFYLDGGVTSRPPQGREQPKVSGGGGSSDYLAMMLDIDYGMGKVKPYHAAILRRYFNPPARPSGYKNHNEIAGALGIEPEALRHRRDRALKALQRKLGGRSPWTRKSLEYQDTRESA